MKKVIGAIIVVSGLLFIIIPLLSGVKDDAAEIAIAGGVIVLIGLAIILVHPSAKKKGRVTRGAANKQPSAAASPPVPHDTFSPEQADSSY